MEALLIYIIKFSICLSLLYWGFVCLLRHTTRFRFNRLVILCGCLVGSLLPFVQLQLEESLVQLPLEGIHLMLSQNDATAIQEESKEAALSFVEVLSPEVIAVFFYIIGCLLVLFVTILSRYRIWTIIRRSKCYKYDLYTLYISSEQNEAFSWGRNIVIPKEVYDNKNDFEGVLLHELSHVRRSHSIDILFIQLIVIFHWFNPFVWLLRRELLDIHEYQADNDVINQGINATQYQLLLVKKAVGGRLYILANGFKHSKLKKRITMMLKKRTNRMSQLRVLLFLPLVIGAVYSFATITPVSVEHVQQWVFPVPDAKTSLKGKYGGKHKHSGIDLVAKKGTQIKAVFDGVVVSSDFDAHYGKVVVIRNNDGLEILYAHNSENLVKKGETVNAGQVVALVGNTGRSTGYHCHLEVRDGGILIDPETVFNVETQTLRTK